LLLCALAVAALAHTASAEDRLDRRAIAARTPRAEEWRAPDVALHDHFSPAELEQWSRYRSRQRRIDLFGLVLDLAVCGVLLTAVGRRAHASAARHAGRLSAVAPFRWRGSCRVGGLLTRAFGEDWAAALLFAGLYFALGVAIDLPIALLHEHAARAVGLSAYTTALWVSHFIKSLLVGVVMFSLLVFGLYGLVRRFPRRWWMVLALPAAIVMVGYRVVSPYGTRLFHHVVPLEQSGIAAGAELGRRLRRLADARGVTLAEIKVVDSSRATRALNAYLTGLGPTRELVLFDTLLRTASVEEVEAAVAHELEHQRGESLALDSALSAAGLAGLLALLAWVLRRGSALLKLAGPGDIRTLPLIGITALLVFNLLLPVASCRSRRAELLADRAALVLTGDPRAFIALQVKLARANKEDVRPSGWVKLWLFSHPPIAERIAQARWYDGWLAARGRR
jgi:STE24 endopeptidase